jgi:hypothetical protein
MWCAIQCMRMHALSNDLPARSMLHAEWACLLWIQQHFSVVCPSINRSRHLQGVHCCISG